MGLLVAALGDYSSKVLLRALPKWLAVAEDDRRELFCQQLLCRVFGLRGVHAEGLAHTHPDLARQAAEGVGGKEEPVLIPKQAGVPARVARGRDHPEAGKVIAFVHHAVNWRSRQPQASCVEAYERIRFRVRRTLP